MEQNLKRDFQKVVKNFRDTLPNVKYITLHGDTTIRRPEYPKAMMTNQQIRKGTATINFQHAGVQIMNDFEDNPSWKAFCLKYGIKKTYWEINQDGYNQLRIFYEV